MNEKHESAKSKEVSTAIDMSMPERKAQPVDVSIHATAAEGERRAERLVRIQKKKKRDGEDAEQGDIRGAENARQAADSPVVQASVDKVDGLVEQIEHRQEVSAHSLGEQGTLQFAQAPTQTSSDASMEGIGTRQELSGHSPGEPGKLQLARELTQAAGDTSMEAARSGERGPGAESSGRGPTGGEESAGVSFEGIGWAVPLAAGLGGLALAGGGGGGGGGGGIVDAVSSTLVSGSVVLGPVVDGQELTVYIYDEQGNELGQGVVNNDGTYSIEVSSTYRGAVLIKVVDGGTGADFIDEATGAEQSIGTNLYAMTVVNGGSVTASVTVLTTLAALESGIDDNNPAAPDAATVTANNAAIGKQYGVNDILSKPVAVNDAGYDSATADAKANGNALALLSAHAEAEGSIVGSLTALQKGTEISEGEAHFAGTDGAALKAGLADAAKDPEVAEYTGTLADKIASSPIAPVIKKIEDDSGSVTGDVASGKATNDRLPKITVDFGEALDADAVLRIFADASAELFVDVPVASGAISAVVDLASEANNLSSLAEWLASAADGDHVLTAVIVSDGVEEIRSSDFVYVLDTTAPSFSETTFAAAENGTAVGTLTATEANGPVSYTLGTGGNEDQFTLATSGALSFKAAKDYEVDAKSYTVNVIATDAAGNQKTQAITVNVTNANEAPTLVATVADKVAVVGQSFNLDLSGYYADPDSGDTRAYSLVGGALPSGLTLNTSTGVISGTAAADATEATYTVRMTDSGGKYAEQAFKLKAVSAPAVQSFTSDVSLANSGDAIVLSVKFNDQVDVTGTPTLTVKLNGVDVTATYASGTGSDTLTFSLTAPTGDGNAVSITGLTVPEGASIIGKSTGLTALTSANVSTSALIIDNTAPSFTSAASANLAENVSGVAYTAEANEANGTVTYTLSGADAALFSIDAATGKVSIQNAANFESPTDAGADNVYDLSVTATDLLGNAATQAVAINVTNVNEAPTAVGTLAAQTAVVDQAFTLAAATVAAAFADVDAGTTLTYSASDLPAGFSIDAATGAITGTATGTGTPTVVVTATDGGGLSVTQSFALTVVSAPVIESIAAVQTLVNAGDALTFNVVMSEAVTVSGEPTLTLSINGQSVTATFASGSGSNTLVFTAIAPSGDGNAVSISGASLNGGTVTGNVSGQSWVTSSVGQSTSGLTIDNTAPSFTSAASANLAENVSGVVYTAAASEANGTVTYTLSGADASLFSIDAATGAVSINSTANFESPADTGADNVYDLSVTATDSLGNAATQAVAINVTNVNEAPTAVGTLAAQTAVVDQAFTLAAATVAAAFADVDAGTTLTYSASGLPAGFSIDAATGAITGTATGTGTPTVVVTATDGGGLSVTQSFVLNVVSAPVIESIAAVETLVNAGDALTFNVVMSEAVTVSGAPTLTLSINGQSVTATFASGSGSNTLVFTAIAPSGDGNAVSISGASLNGGTVTGNVSGQAWVTSSVGQTTSGLTIDNTAPSFTSAASANLAENASGVVYTAAASEANGTVTYTLSGADAALFSIDAATGAVSINSTANFELPTDAGANNVYDLSVTATDSLGNAATQAVAINVTNVNEAPTAVGTIAAQTAVVGQAFTLAAATVAAAFADVDAGTTLTYSASDLPAGFSINAATGAITGTATAAGSQSITVTATDGGGLSATQTFTLSELALPTLSSSIDNVSNFEVTSNIVLTASENVTAVAGKYIHIVNDGGAGFQEETTVHTQDILVTDAMVSIVGNKITINPGFDLDLSNNYHITVDDGAFVGVTSGLGNAAVSDVTAMNFSTVTPGTNALANAVDSQMMVSGTDALVAGKKWLDIEGINNTASASPTSLGDLSAASYALVFKDFDPASSDPTKGDFMSTKDFYVAVTGFGSDDLVYVDLQTNNGETYDPALTQYLQAPDQALTATEFQFTTIVGSSSASSNLDLTAAGNTTGFGSYAELAAYLGTQPIIAG